MRKYLVLHVSFKVILSVFFWQGRYGLRQLVEEIRRAFELSVLSLDISRELGVHLHPYWAPELLGFFLWRRYKLLHEVSHLFVLEFWLILPLHRLLQEIPRVGVLQLNSLVCDMTSNRAL